jgi:GNAT superfamily N-acetyltransferase
MRQIKIASTDEAILQTRGIMMQLYEEELKAVSETEFLARVRLQQAEVGFQLASLIDSGSIICVAGFRLCRNLGWGKYLYVDDLVTDGQHRSQGAGREMFEWLVARARSERCNAIRLDAKLTRKSAHRFYLRERMDIFAFHFCRSVDS